MKAPIGVDKPELGNEGALHWQTLTVVSVLDLLMLLRT